MPRVRWTPEEEEQLLNLIAAGKSWTLISGMPQAQLEVGQTSREDAPTARRKKERELKAKGK